MIYDEETGRKIVSKYILVGLSYIDSKGNLESQLQLHGIVERSSKEEGIVVMLKGAYDGEKVQLPADTSTLQEAAPGVYKLSTTNEEIESPDFVCTFEIHKPPVAADNDTRGEK